MANPSISIPDELLEEFDRILDIKEMMDELEKDDRSPVVQELVREYVEENREYLDRYEAFMEGNGSRRMAATATAD